MISDLRVMQTMVDMAVGVPRFTYQMNRNAPRPEGPYAVIRLRKTTKPGYDKIEYIEGPFGMVQRTKGIRLLEFDLLFSRDDEEIDTFNNSFYRPDIREYLHKQGYALMSSAPLQIKDTKLETDWEVRTGVSITVSVVRTSDVDIDQIKVVEIDGDVYEGSHAYHVGTIKIGDNE